MKFSKALSTVAALSLSFSPASSCACSPFPALVMADMADGDAKQVSLTCEGLLTVSQEEPVWSVTATVNEDCVATVDFEKTDKPEYPPVPLRVRLLASSLGTVELEFTDQTSTLNTDPLYPLNVWTSTYPLPPASDCPSFPKTLFQDLHDGDVKTVSLDAATGVLRMEQEGIWHLETTVDFSLDTESNCQALVDFSKTSKPDQPPVPLVVTVAVASGAGAADERGPRYQLVFTDKTGTINEDDGYPLNIWQAV